MSMSLIVELAGGHSNLSYYHLRFLFSHTFNTNLTTFTPTTSTTNNMTSKTYSYNINL
jgi:hypothetical protein